MADSEPTDRIPTWRDGVILSMEQRAALTPDQWRQFSSDSMVRDLSEIDQMPEHLRSWAHQALDTARARATGAASGSAPAGPPTTSGPAST